MKHRIFAAISLVVFTALLPAGTSVSAAWDEPLLQSRNLTAQAGSAGSPTLPIREGNPARLLGGGGPFVVAVGVEPAGLDPALHSDSAVWQVTSQVYETLVTTTPGGSQVVPGLAQSWSVSADGLTWTFNLRSGVQFHDGTALNAAAVAYNIERWWDPAHLHYIGDASVFASFFGGHRGEPGCLLSAVDTVGASQVRLTLTGKYSPLPSLLAMPAFQIASPLAIQAGTLDTVPVGSGPFKFFIWDPGDHVTLEDNPDYWGEEPHLDSLTFEVVANENDRFLALQGNSAQGVGDLSPDYAGPVSMDPNLVARWRPAMAIGYLGINRSHTPLDVPEVRQAIAHAIDRESLIADLYNPGDQVADQFLPPAIFGYDASIVDYTYDPPLAHALLELVGYGGGFSTTLAYRDVIRAYLPDAPATAAAIRADLLAVGINATLIQYESGEFLDKAMNGELDLFLLGWTQDYAHPDNYFAPILCDNYLAYGPKDEVLCAFVAAAREEEDFENQLVFYEWASNRVHDTLPLLPIAHPRTLLATRDNVHGLVPALGGIELFGDVWLANAWVHLPLVLR
jgi:peptide/nickel transport system substrate-binding protein